MRIGAFLSGSDAPRPFSEVVAERRRLDPRQRAIDLVAGLELEADEARRAGDVNRARDLQCEAEEVRAAIHENRKAL